MDAYHIDVYHYSNKDDAKKEEFYRHHILTEEEKIKTEEIMKKLDEFIIKTDGEKSLEYFHNTKEGKIHYRNDLGYITTANYDRDEVIVFGYGKTFEEAFFTALVEYEFDITQSYELHNRQMLNKQFSERFLDGNYSKEDYHGPFFFAELALQDFRKYYGDNIPEELINDYEEYLKSVELEDYQYDYETNRLVKKLDTNKI